MINFDEIADLGPHFSFQVRDSAAVVEAASRSGTGSWRPLELLLDGSGALVERYEQVRNVLSALAGRQIDFRVAASTGHLGLVARLICPVFGAALLGYRVDLGRAWWQPTVGGAMPLSVPRTAITTTAGRSGLATSEVVELVERTAALSVSPLVLWGNVASAVNGAATTASAVRPDLAGEARSLAASFVERLDLTGTFVGLVGSSFRRRSCCLIYRIAPAGSVNRSYCGDCVLTRPDAS